MTISLFMTIDAEHRYSTDLCRYLRGEPREFLSSVTGLESADLFAPVQGKVAAFDQSEAPALLIQLAVDSTANADRLLRSDPFRRLLLAESAYGTPVEGVSLDVLETVHFPVPGHGTPPVRNAPLSFMVRYNGPTDDLAAFDRFYMDNHPPILARFPEIRNVLCYLPPDWRSAGAVRDSRLILGNEVVFDDLDALNRALESDVMPLLIADGKRFPKFGSNSHHAMLRERFYPALPSSH